MLRVRAYTVVDLLSAANREVKSGVVTGALPALVAAVQNLNLDDPNEMEPGSEVVNCACLVACALGGRFADMNGLLPQPSDDRGAPHIRPEGGALPYHVDPPQFFLTVDPRWATPDIHMPVLNLEHVLTNTAITGQGTLALTQLQSYMESLSDQRQARNLPIGTTIRSFSNQVRSYSVLPAALLQQWMLMVTVAPSSTLKDL